MAGVAAEPVEDHLALSHCEFCLWSVEVANL